ncbi:ApeP family dehydratase [Chitinibacteraceae bacterium HSL-7]
MKLPCPIERYVPHARTMSLLDTVLAVDAQSLTAEVTLREDSPFCRDGVVGAWVGVEYMAQAVAALAGVDAASTGQPPAVGFLLGTRRFETSVPHFCSGQTLTITVTREFAADNGIAVMQCRIEEQGRTLCSAALSVYQPDNLQDYLKQ